MASIESHVRSAHLQRPEFVEEEDEEERDYEEEFYYTEIEEGNTLIKGGKTKI